MSEKIVFNPKNKMQYYVFQLIGWLIFTILLGLAMSYNESVPNSFYWFLGLNLLFNLLLSHLYRYLILKINWTKGGLGIVLFKLFFSSVLLGIIFSYFTNATNVILNNGEIFKTESLINGFILGS